MSVMDKLNQLIFNLYGAAHECSASEFDEHALTLTRQILAFESATVVAATFSKDDEIKIQSIHINNQPVEKLLDRKYLSSPDTVLIDAYRNKGKCIIADSSIENRDKPDLIKYCKKYDVAHTLVLINDGVTKSSVDVIALWRARQKKAYTAIDTKMGEVILPHLFQARAINRRIHIHKYGSNPLERMSLLASLDGCLQFMDDVTIDFLRNEWPHWEPPVLPSIFMNALNSVGTRQYVGKTFMAGSTVHNKFLFIQLTPKPLNLDLTEAETTVAWLASNGMSYKEVARELGKSPATVRNQLHSAYAKLGVNNKTSLAASLSLFSRTLPARKP